jgi:hypothetical protein
MFKQRFRIFPVLAVLVTMLFALVVVSTARSATPAPSVQAKHDLKITQIAPAANVIGAGTNVTIRGTGFASGAKVYFNETAATDVTVVSATVIRATVPENVATTPVDVTVQVGVEAAALSHGANAVVRGYKNDKGGPGKGGPPTSSSSETTPTGNPAPRGGSSAGTAEGTTAVQPIPSSR